MAKGPEFGSMAISEGPEDLSTFTIFEGAQPINIDTSITARAIFLATFSIVFSLVLIFILYQFCNVDNVFIVPGILIVNTFLICRGSGYAVKYILFPFANHYMK